MGSTRAIGVLDQERSLLTVNENVRKEEEVTLLGRRRLAFDLLDDRSLMEVLARMNLGEEFGREVDDRTR